MNIFRKSVKYLAATALMAGSTIGGNAVAQDYNWRAVTHQLPGTARFEGTVTPFTKCVGDASGGRMKIQAFGGGVLHPVADSLDAIRDGVVQMGMIWSGYWAGRDPVFALAGSRPGDPIASFSENFYRAERLHDIVAAAYDKQGVKSLGAFDFAPPEILNSFVIEPVRHTGSTDDKELIVNPTAWDGLPDDLKSIVLACRDQARYLGSTAYGIGNERAKQEWIDAGVSIVELPEADVAEARKIGAKVMLDAAAQSPEATEYLRQYAETLKELGYVELAEALGAQ